MAVAFAPVNFHRWRTGGPTCDAAPEWEIHAYNPDLYILRENGCVNYEKPFLYLLFGSEKALLIDTGAGETHVASAVSGVIDEWAARNHRPAPPLLVGHSHSHDDHIAGDAQFRARANTTVVPLTVEATMKTFGIRIGRMASARSIWADRSSMSSRFPATTCLAWPTTIARRESWMRAIASIPAGFT